MKTRPSILSLFLLFSIVPCSAQTEPNPFIRGEKEKPSGPTGAPFVAYTEHLLVDPALLDAWLDKHPLKNDAGELREQMRQWTIEGKAELDQIATVQGVIGRASTAYAIMEQIYPTEYDEQSPGIWPLPTAFTTLNIGLTMETGVVEVSGEYNPWTTIDFVEMTSPGTPWNQTADRTRQPGDIFFPRFRNMQIESIKKNREGESPSHDPFAETSAPGNSPDATVDRSPQFTWDTVQLAGRIESSNEATGKTRLIFYRAYSSPEQSGLTKLKSAEVSRISFLTLKTNARDYSAWLSRRDRDDAWAAADAWLESGRASRGAQLSSLVNPGRLACLGTTETYTYPTEWIPMSDNEKEAILSQGKDPLKIALTAASSPSAFEERNLGFSIEAEVIDDEKGAFLSFNWSHVALAGTSVCRRIEVNGEWKPDATMPVFAARKLASSVRLETGKWLFLGQTAGVGTDGHPDREHCLLVFAKAE